MLKSSSLATVPVCITPKEKEDKEENNYSEINQSMKLWGLR